MSASPDDTGGPSDREIIQSSLSRPERFEAVFERHAAAIYRYLRRRAGDGPAEELLAETFARAFAAAAASARTPSRRSPGSSESPPTSCA